MKTNFTKGPWKYNMGFIIANTGNGHAPVFLLPESKIAEKHPFEDSFEANSKLAAAAPELYELVDLLANVLVNAVDPNDFGKILTKKVLPVLKKARGEGE